MTAYLIPPLILLTGFSALFTGCASTGTTSAPIPTTYHADASGRYAGRDEVRTNAATGRPEVMRYDAKGKFIGITR